MMEWAQESSELDEDSEPTIKASSKKHWITLSCFLGIVGFKKNLFYNAMICAHVKSKASYPF